MIEARRARPLLGTRVEVAVWGAAREPLLAVAGEALDEVERVHRLLSFHDPQSELTRLNREAHGVPQPVDRRTRRLLRMARELHRASGGAFDPAVAPRLVAEGLLPTLAGAPHPSPAASFADVELLGDGRVRYRRPLWLDFGGLAKGFAVDRAIAVLRRGGVRRAIVDAGGDLRVLGGEPVPVVVRVGASRFAEAVVALANAAVASSGSSQAPHIVDPAGRRAHPELSATVIARSCALADGLTKVGWVDPAAATAALRRFAACALRCAPAVRRVLPDAAAWDLRGAA